MKAHFPIRTGNIGYIIPLNAPTTGDWSVSLGFSGISENTWNMSGVSGKIYDNTGYMVGAYPQSQPTTISGSIFENYHSIYQDDILLSNCITHIPNDYTTVSAHGNFIGGYIPSVEVIGQSVQNPADGPGGAQTHQFWKNENDRIFFVTENAVADTGFIDIINSMGIAMATGSPTGISGGAGFDESFGMIIFGAATTSGAYNSGAWNSLNSSMMSLNSHLVCPQNLAWYGAPQGAGGDTLGTIQSSGYQTGAVFPQEYRSPENTKSIWAEFPTQGWFKLFLNPATSALAPEYIPYGVGGGHGGDTTDHYVKFEYSSPNTTVSMYDGIHFTDPTFSTDVRPFTYYDGLEHDLELTFVDVVEAGGDDVIVKLSNTLGGTGAPSFTWTGTAWGRRQVDSGRVVPQTDNYNIDTVFRHTTLTSGNYPTDQFSMYEGEMSAAHGQGGHTLISNMDTGKILTAFPKGFWTGNVIHGDFVKNSMVVFSVTPTGMGWETGQNMWDTLTSTGKRLFVNSVAELFLSSQR